MKHRHWIALFVPLCALLSASCNAPTAVAPERSSENNNQLVRVDVRSPKKQLVRDKTTQPATVHADFEAKIHAKVAGYLDQLNADIGQSVKKDESLATIAVPELQRRKEKLAAIVEKHLAEENQAEAEVSVAKSKITAAQASLTADESELARVTELVKDKSVARRLLEEATERRDSSNAQKAAADASLLLAKANAKTAKARTEVARKELLEIDALLEYANLKSPFDGVVVARNVEPGDFVRNAENGSAGQKPLFIVSKLDRVRVRVPIPERDTPLVRVGAKATVDLIALRGQPINATVTRISNTLDDATRTMLAEIEIENPDRKLLAGMFGQATIELAKRPNCVVLPAELVRYDEAGSSYVLVCDDQNKVKKIDVTTGLDNGTIIEITTGLEGNERVIAPGARRLQEGQQVEPVSK